MNQALRRILVIGGNGFIGSAVCRIALAKGFQVTSVSSSGRPYQTPKGHSPDWVSKVDWQKGDALDPRSFAHLFAEVGGVVHTLGTLFEDSEYKQALKEGNIPALVGSLFRSVGLADSGNPLTKEADGEKKGSYEVLNHDAALRVCEAFLSSSSSLPSNVIPSNPRPFIFISAEDIFRPVIPARYIETKREAERRIEEMMINTRDYRGVYIRPSLVYHAHYRPLTTPAAVLLDLSASLHSKIPVNIPTPSSILRSLGSAFQRAGSPDVKSSPLESLANALSIPPIHVDHVAEAICVALDSASQVRGVVDVRRMRELIGWHQHGS